MTSDTVTITNLLTEKAIEVVLQNNGLLSEYNKPSYSEYKAIGAVRWGLDSDFIKVESRPTDLDIDVGIKIYSYSGDLMLSECYHEK